MASVKVLLYQHKTLSDGTHPILISVIKDLKRKTYSLGYSAKPSQWNEEKNLPNKHHPNRRELTLKIERAKADFINIILELENKGRDFTAADVVRYYSKETTDVFFTEYCDKWISFFKETGKNGNAIVYGSALSSFKDFANGKEYRLVDMTFETIQRYHEYLQRKTITLPKKKTTKKLTANGISFYMRTLRAIINKAIKDGLMDESMYPFKKLSITSEKTRKRAVNKEVIKMVEDLDVGTEENLQFYKDLFMFSFYNRGMNFVDMAFLKVRDLQGGRLNYARQKTGQQFSIKITDKAQTIIDRYNDLQDPDSYIFPIITHPGKEYQDYRNAMRLMNRKLKKISQKLKLDVNLTTYVSRHSWATIAKKAGISTAIISEGLGHTTEEITQVYLDSFENDTLDAANEIITG